MTYSNGKVPASDLVQVEHGQWLSTPTANAYKALVAAAKAKGIAIRFASGVGSGYRSLAVQQDYWDAYHGNAAAAKRVGLNPDSRIPVAAPGGSSHGYATAADLLFNDSSNPNSAEIALAEHYGFKRQFGADDPNHFLHDGRTAIHPPAAARKSTTAQKGEGLFAVAARVHVPEATLERLNPGIRPSALALGQKIWIS